MNHSQPPDELDEWTGSFAAAHFTIKISHRHDGDSHPSRTPATTAASLSILPPDDGTPGAMDPKTDTDRTSSTVASSESLRSLDVDDHHHHDEQKNGGGQRSHSHSHHFRLVSPRKSHHHHHHNHHHDEAPAPAVDPTDWGFPGYLSPTEAEIFDRFRAEVDRRPKAFREAIFSLGSEEPEEYALCRWLRARKFVLEDVLSMVEAAAAERVEPTLHDFYPDAKDALGVEEAVVKTQYPQVFTGGHSKTGRPLFFSKPGVVNIHGLQAVVTPEGCNRYQWHAMHHAFAERLRERQGADPAFVRFQSVVVMDLEHLSRSTVNSKVLEIIQHQSRVDALCYPEILGVCVIVNAPTFFSAIWAIIRRWLDPRTAGKIEIFSFKSSAEKRLRELIDLEHLPSDYGGNAPSVSETIVKQGCVDGTSVTRRITKLMHVKGHSSFIVELEKGEEMEVVVFTRSVGGAIFRVAKADGKAAAKDVPSEEEATVHCPEDQSGEHDPPFCHAVARNVRGPGRFRIHGEAHKSRFSSADHFLVVVNISRTPKMGPSRLPSNSEHYVYQAY